MHLWKTALMASLAASTALAQLTYKGCDPLSASDFQVTELFNKKGTAEAVADPTLSEPTRMDIQVIKKNGIYDHSNIYFVERLGKVKFFDGAAKTVTVMGKINIWGKGDNSLMGMALDPHFETNHWMYFWYCPNELVGQNRKLRLTRITARPDNTLDMSTEKILIEILANTIDNWHSGGPMTFDAYGDLWVAVGNNSKDLVPETMNVLSTTDSSLSAEWGSSNTHSLRGGFFRIHPDSSDKGYAIPKGNFGDYWADQWEQKGRHDLALQYRDPNKVLPEVYVKGERSNFSIAVHPTKRWLAWGTVNYASIYDEFNITDHPIFSGYPYFHADNKKTCPLDTNHLDPAAPKNTSPFNSGVVELPPAIPASINFLVNMSISGPIYSFDPSLNSDVKFPPHFDNKWLVAGFKGGMWAVTVDTNTLKVLNTQALNTQLSNPPKIDTGIFKSIHIRNHVMSKFGPDGALYILNYDGYYDLAFNPGVMRVTYKGNCHLPITAVKPLQQPEPYQNIMLSGTSLKVSEKGTHRFSLHDFRGHCVFQTEGKEGAEYSFAGLMGQGGLRPGIYSVSVQTARGLFHRRISLL